MRTPSAVLSSLDLSDARVHSSSTVLKAELMMMMMFTYVYLDKLQTRGKIYPLHTKR
jgi:hypothetical protein